MNKTAEGMKANERLPHARIKRDKSWLFWLIPAGAALLCAWFAYRDFVSMGPMITITFADGEGLQTKNTPVTLNGVTVGQVREIELTKDKKKALVKVRMLGTAKHVARQGSIFWVVHPDVKVGMISGLRTIVSGEYIEMRPGDGPETNQFSGLLNEPVAEKPDALEITLTAPDLSSLQEESPIFYKGIQVGEVLYYQLDSNAKDVVIHARIWREFAPLVRTDSKFWNAGGVNFHFGLLKGLQITAESPKTLIVGGIEFATPPEVGMQATNGTLFVLSEKSDDKWKTWSPEIPLELPKKASNSNVPTNGIGNLNPIK